MAQEKRRMKDRPEALLDQALVPAEEQPYEVPKNWVWTTLANVITLISGRDVSLKLCNSNNLGIPYILGASNLDGGQFSAERWIEKPVVVSVAGDLLLSVKGTIGKVHLQMDPEVNISRQIMALRSSSALLNHYLMYYIILSSEQLKSSGNGLIPGISRETILSMPFPLPPLAEQQRIVDRIESLFAKLDQAQELVQNALDTFETRKAAILHKAFTGELTAKWRARNGVGTESWVEYRLKDVCRKITDGTHHSPNNHSVGDYMYITAKNIKEGGIDLSNITYVSKEDHEEIFKRCNVELGDVLYIKDGATTGIAAVNTIETPFSLLSSVALLKVDHELLDTGYLVHNLNSPGTKSKMVNNMSGNAITRLTLTKIKETSITLPSLPEQVEIVRILGRLSEEGKAAQRLVALLDRIEMMKKAILERAFRGELGTNDATEASSMTH